VKSDLVKASFQNLKIPLTKSDFASPQFLKISLDFYKMIFNFTLVKVICKLDPAGAGGA
jgi:hypothetical protein